MLRFLSSPKASPLTLSVICLFQMKGRREMQICSSLNTILPAFNDNPWPHGFIYFSLHLKFRKPKPPSVFPALSLNRPSQTNAALSFRLFILRLFNVRSKELWRVKNLFSFKCVQGISIDIFFATALILFLNNHDVKDLPLIYIFSSILLWLVGYAYTQAEHRLSVKNLVLTAILF